ncbi:hypothetical protein ASD37_13905 [Mycobacterium sp. Root135]|uniref:hypothetical protein n=1 Tax=Mycobacterium sp. Root135 TaxID=1736457 RepID=UPI0006F7A3AB|nr:hypothetical protein [Mycobacterium sp. Root135]KQY07167.1 hypothetical protein ASD37_13905 [Mycobacterium sp. Root135]
MSSTAVDPDGVEWSVRRRWYPWRRALSLRDLWSSTPGGKKAASEADSTEPEESALPKNFLLKAFFIVAAAIVWVVYSIGKLLFYTAVVVLFLVGSIVELAVALVVMPIALLLRVIGQSRWPVEIGRQGEHVLTRHAEDFAAAGELRDGLLTDIGRGLLPVAEKVPSADSK